MKRRTALSILAVVLAAIAGFALVAARQGGGMARSDLITAAPAAPADQAEQAPMFTLNSLDGEAVKLGEVLEDHKVLLVFGTTWCPACVRSVSALKKLHRELEDGESDHQATLLSVNVGEDPERVAAFVRNQGITYPVLLDEEGKVAREYKLVGVPTYIVVNRDRTIAYSGHSLPEARRYIDP